MLPITTALGYAVAARLATLLRDQALRAELVPAIVAAACFATTSLGLFEWRVLSDVALAPALESGQVSLADRNQLLSEVTPEITQRVLGHNRSQARALAAVRGFLRFLVSRQVLPADPVARLRVRRAPARLGSRDRRALARTQSRLRAAPPARDGRNRMNADRTAFAQRACYGRRRSSVNGE